MLFPTELAPQPLHLFLKQLSYVAQASFELSITQPLPPMCWRCSFNGKIDNSESLISWRPRPEADECLSIFWYMCSLWVPFLRIYNAFMLLSLSNLDFSVWETNINKTCKPVDNIESQYSLGLGDEPAVKMFLWKHEDLSSAVQNSYRSWRW